MQRVFTGVALFLSCVHSLDAGGSARIGALTMPELAAKVGFPHRVEMLSSTARGGPGEVFWYYCQRSQSGKIEEKMVAFNGRPLRVSETDVGVDPTRFLSLERSSDIWQIRVFETAHGH